MGFFEPDAGHRHNNPETLKLWNPETRVPE